MKPKKKTIEVLKKELEAISNTPLTDSQLYESYFNLSGFCKVLRQMKKEAQNASL